MSGHESPLLQLKALGILSSIVGPLLIGGRQLMYAGKDRAGS